MKKMDFCGAYRFDLRRTCRGCLLQDSQMNSITENNLSVMFTSITNFEVKGGGDEPMPSNLCSECTDKLMVAYNFQSQCFRSNDVLVEYLQRIRPKIEGFGDGDVALINRNDQGGVFNKSDSENDGGGGVGDDPCKRRPGRKQSLRLEQFSPDEVARAIEDSKRRFFENAQCIRCGFVGSNMRALSVHISHLHKELKERWCSRCNAEFDDLNTHLVCHDGDDLRCRFCDKSFTAKGHLTEHLRSHSGVRPFKCDACGKSFISRRHLRVHFRTHSDDRLYKCRYCSRRFTQRASLEDHLNYHECGDVFTCGRCGGAFEQQKELEEHLCKPTENAHSPLQNFCETCNKKVRSLDSHVERHHSVAIVGKSDQSVLEAKLCTVCGKQFKTASKLRVHMRIHTGEAPYKCSFCDKRTSTRNQLVVHERTHTGEKPHVCNVCGKAFAQSSVLNTHMRLHTGRPEQCQICDQRFCRPSELKLHMRKHTGEKPYICSDCNQTFKQRSHLMEHIKTHSDERPFRCAYCDRAFKQNSSLKSHILIHLGRKPFQCNYCPYACRQSYSLTQHMKQHADEVDGDVARTDDKSYGCTVCHKSFNTASLLKSHLFAEHDTSYAIEQL